MNEQKAPPSSIRRLDAPAVLSVEIHDSSEPVFTDAPSEDSRQPVHQREIADVVRTIVRKRSSLEDELKTLGDEVRSLSDRIQAGEDTEASLNREREVLHLLRGIESLQASLETTDDIIDRLKEKTSLVQT
jgi:predicted RNase H-like nuclease (RuvC/YqgF family)